MLRVVLVLAFSVGCYSPSFRDCDVTCATGEACPAGLTCAGGYCVADTSATCSGTVDDADVRRDMAADADLSAPWGTPTAVNMPAGYDDDPTVTGDGLEMYFNRMMGGVSDIYRVVRFQPTTAWTSAQLVSELDSLNLDATPEVSADGFTMYFTSDRPGGLGDADIWLARRTPGQPWSVVGSLPALNTASLEAGAQATNDGMTIVFYSNRTPGQNSDLFTSSLINGTWSAPVSLTSLNSTSADESPFLTDDKLTIYFNSNRSGEHELYKATRTSPGGTFGAPTPITELNTSNQHETDPFVTPDGRHIYFSRLDPVTNTARLYEAVR